MPELNYQSLQAEALRLGFVAFGCAPAEALQVWRQKQWHDYLAAQRHAEMHYLGNNLEKRMDPRLLVEGAKTVVSVALNYNPGDVDFKGFRLAKYAVGRDYHEVMREKLQALLRFVETQSGGAVSGRSFCDTAPVDEHYWAWRCGLGWLGRNTQLHVPGCGSFVFLGELILTAPMDRCDEPMAAKCGGCNRCIEACPMNALSVERGLDARRCLSYLTIEHRGDFPAHLQPLPLSECIYGCDCCIAACPHNQKARLTAEDDFKARASITGMKKEEWRQLTQDDFSRVFKGSAVKRTKHAGLMRNIKAVNSRI
jgi:epoxyqueuosine reductase